MNHLLYISIAVILSNNLLIKNPVVHIGKIKAGQKKEITFIIKNNNAKPIKILSVSSTCGCTIPKYPGVLPANKNTEITAIFDSKGMTGFVKKDLVLVVEDQLKFYKLSFTCEVISSPTSLLP